MVSQTRAAQSAKPKQPVSAQAGVLQRKCDGCKKKWSLQKKAMQQGTSELSPTVHDILRSPGQPLDAETRAFMEPGLEHDFSRITLFPPARGVIQTKLAINAPGDRYEQEADRIADQVMATPEHHAVSGASPRTQRFAVASTRQALEAPVSVNRALASPGRPLEPALRQDMEGRFGHDFSGVRVHTGTAAEQSARDVNAHAYTVGCDVVFGANQFAPRTYVGQRLIAHELAHVVQQANGMNFGQNNYKRGISPIAPSAIAPYVIQRNPAGGFPLYEIISPVWNVAGRDIVVVRIRADNRVFLFYRRTGSGFKGKGSAPPPGSWAPFDAITTEELIGRGESVVERPYIEKNPYYRRYDKPELRGYGTQTNKDIADWLNAEKIKEGKKLDWRVVQAELERYKPLATSSPPARTASGEIGGPGGAGEPSRPVTTPGGETTVPKPKGGFRARLGAAKGSFVEGLKGAFSAESIAAEIPLVVLHFADIAAAREAIRTIQIKFAKEGFAKGVAAGVLGWREEEVQLNLNNLVTSFRVRGLEDPAGILTSSYIFQLAEAYENYAVDLGFQFSSSKTLKWKEDLRAKGFAILVKRGDMPREDPEVYLFETEFIKMFAKTLRPITDPIIDEAIEKGEAKRKAAQEAERQKMLKLGIIRGCKGRMCP